MCSCVKSSEMFYKNIIEDIAKVINGHLPIEKNQKNNKLLSQFGYLGHDISGCEGNTFHNPVKKLPSAIIIEYIFVMAHKKQENYSL